MKNNLYKKIICVYEYGEKGRAWGKYHLHILLTTNTIIKFCEAACTIFGTESKRWRNTVVRKVINCDNNTPDEFKQQNMLSNVRYIAEVYMRKEVHNKVKCLFTNILKKKILRSNII